MVRVQPDKIAEFLHDFAEAIRYSRGDKRLLTHRWVFESDKKISHYEVAVSKRAFHALAEYRAEQDIKAAYGEEEAS